MEVHDGLLEAPCSSATYRTYLRQCVVHICRREQVDKQRLTIAPSSRLQYTGNTRNLDRK